MAKHTKRHPTTGQFVPKGSKPAKGGGTGKAPAFGSPAWRAKYSKKKG